MYFGLRRESFSSAQGEMFGDCDPGGHPSLIGRWLIHPIDMPRCVHLLFTRSTNDRSLKRPPGGAVTSQLSSWSLVISIGIFMKIEDLKVIKNYSEIWIFFWHLFESSKTFVISRFFSVRRKVVRELVMRDGTGFRCTAICLESRVVDHPPFWRSFEKWT